MDEAIADMDEDMANMEAQQPETDNIFEQEEYKQEPASQAQNSATLRVRQYDLSITYDYYHRTPRLWLQGYSEDGNLLTLGISKPQAEAMKKQSGAPPPITGELLC